MFFINFKLMIFIFLLLPFGANSNQKSDLNNSENYKLNKESDFLKFKKEGKPVISDKWMVVTANIQASKIAAKILKNGGTAADAMISAQLVLGLVEPESSGLGGGAFLVYFDNKTKEIITLDGRETAPLLIKANVFHGGPRSAINANDGHGGGDLIQHNLV